MKTTINQIYGNFDLKVEVEYEEKDVPTLIALGALQVMQRVPASTADKKIDGKNWVKGKKEGTLLKPEKWSRTTNIPFTPETAKAIQDGAMGTTVSIAEDVALPFKVVSVTEHESGDASPMKRATAFVELMFGGPMETNLRDTFDKLGLANALEATKEQLVEFAHSKGFGADPKKV
jgi:hypothetical protein